MTGLSNIPEPPPLGGVIAPKPKSNTLHQLATSTSIESFSHSIESTSPPGSQRSAKGTRQVPALIQRYRLETLLGRGGFGEVWKAFDTQLQRYVAIKAPRTDRVVTADLVHLFLSEAERMQRLAATRIVPVLDVVQAPTERGDFLCFIVMEWMEGGESGSAIA